jgi:protein phosphatase
MAYEPAPGTQSAVLSDRGRRRSNQDAVLAAALRDGGELVAVADGMGGYAGGEVASRRALEELRVQLDAGAGLVDAVRAANRAVYSEGNGEDPHEGMGTTLVALLRRGREYYIANVGDSRAYRVDRTGVRQITVDHSFVAEAVRSGLLSSEEAEKSRWRNAVTRAVGTDPELEEVDCFGPFDATEAHAVVLCTDGLYRVLDEASLADVATSEVPVAEAVAGLVTAAYDEGSEDNISIGLIRFVARENSPLGAVPAAAQPLAAAGAQPLAAAAAPARPRDDDPGRRRRPRHRHGRWTPVELAVVILGILAVMVYMVMLAVAF